MLKSLAIRSVYKSDEDNILEDFYFPTLSVACSYDRAVGFFSASALYYAAQALSTFVRNNGRIRLILGAFTDQRDIDAVAEGLRLREVSEQVADRFFAAIQEVDSELFQRRFEALAWLVARRRLEIKVALRANGMYHDKVGIIRDSNGDAIVFSGSANESAQALLPTHNYESIDAFPSWIPAFEGHFKAHEAAFERLWRNESRNTAVIDLPKAIEERLLSVASGLTNPPDPEREASIAALVKVRDEERNRRYDLGPRLPDSLNGNPFAVKDHQKAALNEWRVKGAFQGILDLATGAGKTITAIYGIVQMAKNIPGLTVIIAAPYQNLADQWCEILEQFNIRALKCYVSKGAWLDDLQAMMHDVEMGARNFSAIVVVNRTLKSPEFQSALRRIPGNRLLWIGDECHHHSSESFDGFLPDNARYRLGLSATPNHYASDERNARLKAYYGDVVFTYSLEQAIRDKVLTPYNYFPHIVSLTADEGDDFIKLSEEIARQMSRLGGKGRAKMPTALTALLMRRARIVGSAANKLPALEQTLNGNPAEAHSLFYCGDGWVESQDDDEVDSSDSDAMSGRQIEVVSQKLDRLGWRLSRFTSRESRTDREAIMRNFRVGFVDALVAIRCLDEGIDVPACKTAYILASSRDPRQFIQRRGRILRKSPGKDVANIHDYIVVLPEGANDDTGHARKLVKSELQRVAEFSALAINKHSAYEALRTTLVAYGLEYLI